MIMNCHYSVQGDYKCTKPKEVATTQPATKQVATKQVAAKQVATTQPATKQVAAKQVATTKPVAKQAAKFTNVYFADPELNGENEFGSHGEEHFADEQEFGCENGECFSNGENEFGSDEEHFADEQEFGCENGECFGNDEQEFSSENDQENPSYESFGRVRGSNPYATFKATATPKATPKATPQATPKATPPIIQKRTQGSKPQARR